MKLKKLNKTAIVSAIALGCAMLTVQAKAAPSRSQVNYRILRWSAALHINADGSYSETVTRVSQPLTVAGVSTVGHLEIAYPLNFATVKVLDAYTETVHHQRVDVPASQIFNQSTPAAVQAPFLTDGHVESLLYSAVTPGSEVHLKYVETFKRPYLPGVYAVSTVLAPQIPVLHAEISITAPKSMHLYFHARGAWHETHTSSGGMETITASAALTSVNFPPMNTPAITQYAPMAVLSTAGNWDTIARAYDQVAKNAMKATPAIHAMAQKIADGASGEAAVASVYHWMQQHVQSVSVDYHHAGFRPPAAQSTLARSVGDSNSNVALLCAMLHTLGIGAVPAMISQSDRFVPYPGVDPFAFSHFLAYVPAYHLFLDTTSRYAGVNDLPASDQGRPVLITGAKPQLSHTPGPPPGLVEMREVQALTLKANGDIEGHSVITSAGWHAMQTRRDLLGDRSGRRLQQFMQNRFYLEGNAGSMHVVAVRNRKDLDKPVGIVLQWHDGDVAIPGKQMALLLPTPGAIAGTLVPFTSQSTRRTPSVVQPVTIEEVTHLRLPSGMTPEQLPSNQNLKAPFADYSATYSFANGVLSVDKRLQVTQFVVGPQAYPELHKLALMVVSSKRKAVVLHSAG